MISTATQAPNEPSDKTPEPTCIGMGQRTRRIIVKPIEAHTAIFTWTSNLAPLSNFESLGGSTSSTRAILSFNIDHLNSLSGAMREPSTAIAVPPKMPHKLPTTHGQSDIIVPYFTSPNSVAA